MYFADIRQSTKTKWHSKMMKWKKNRHWDESHCDLPMWKASSLIQRARCQSFMAHRHFLLTTPSYLPTDPFPLAFVYQRIYEHEEFSAANLVVIQCTPNPWLTRICFTQISLKPPWLMGGHRGARKMNLFYYRGFMNHIVKVPPMK